MFYIKEIACDDGSQTGLYKLVLVMETTGNYGSLVGQKWFWLFIRNWLVLYV
ncbi:hypothetical protein [Aquimarina sp. Aq107]|uniref:hypothetical protein n=1 Tax=Aquimarina sp. Aq107 TaxID=1191912 RepID=UPI00131F3A7C|nr:hypothetical protein [Aquimarina sp. Aq107]